MLGWLVVCAAASSAMAEADRTRVNAFYRALVAAIAQEHSRAETVTELVKKDRKLADTCLKIIREKRPQAGDKEESFRYLEEKLEEGMLLATSMPTCELDVLRRLEGRLDKTYNSDDRIFVVKTLVRLCPEEGRTYYHKLGDMYLAQRQFGMAVEAYKKGLSMKDDEDSKKLLGKAQGLLASYRDSGNISEAAVKALFKDKRMAAVPGTLRRRVEMVNAAQTNRILFEEWSYEIKGESVPGLTELGEALKKSFVENRQVRILIEGHTDKRGDPARNQRLSEQRAEAVKNYLVQNFGLDDSRFEAKGFGSSRPFAPEDTPEGFALNRRVEFKKVDNR